MDWEQVLERCLKNLMDIHHNGAVANSGGSISSGTGSVNKFVDQVAHRVLELALADILTVNAAKEDFRSSQHRGTNGHLQDF